MLRIASVWWVVLLATGFVLLSPGPGVEAQEDTASDEAAGATAADPERELTPADKAFQKKLAALNERYGKLEEEARKLNEAYRALLETRVVELAERSATLRNLREIEFFTADLFIAGLPAEPISALPWLRKVLEELDERARILEAEFATQVKDDNERLAVAFLDKLHRRQQRFREDDLDGDGILDYAQSFEELAKFGLFPEGAEVEYKASGYVFRLLHGDILTYSAEAVPETNGQTGDLHYFVDQTGVIRYATNELANAASTPVR